jgi:uncharacterized repeat protein (TIGR01451 family)
MYLKKGSIKNFRDLLLLKRHTFAVFFHLTFLIIALSAYLTVNHFEFEEAKANLTADLLISQAGYSCGIDNICGNSDDNSAEVKPGETVEYNITYDNLVPNGVENAVITDSLSAGTCYELNSLESNQPNYTTLSFSNDNGSSWTYTPGDSGDGTDCNVTDWRLEFNGDLTGPIWNYQEANPANSADYKTFTDVVDTGIGDLRLKSKFSAKVPEWTARTDWDLPDEGSDSVPTFADLDGDKDLDAMIGYGTNVLGYENTGTVTSPVWTRNYIWDVGGISGEASPSLVDIDDDGDFDLFVGDAAANTTAYQNIGTAKSPEWSINLGWNLPNTPYRHARPGFSDLDNDHDYDALVGDDNGYGYGVENIGTNTSPNWALKPAWNTTEYVGTGGGFSPAFGDIDFDGDIDLYAGGDFFSSIRLFENIGTVDTPIWSRNSNWDLNNFTYESAPEMVDIDGDSDLDFIIGTANGDSNVYEVKYDYGPVWRDEPEWNLPDLGQYSAPELGDLDNDGDLDIMMAVEYQGVIGYENIGDKNTPVWSVNSSWNSPVLSGVNYAGVVDIDNDEDLDLFIGNTDGIVYAYENTGSVNNPVWTAKPFWNTPDSGSSADPGFADLDNDGDYDLIVGELSGRGVAYENTGSVNNPVWMAKPSWDMPDIGDNASPSFKDMDNDGDIDILSGIYWHDLVALENVGTASNPSWEIRNIWGKEGVWTRTMPTLGDLDNDGNYDVLVGGQDGEVRGMVNYTLEYFNSIGFYQTILSPNKTIQSWVELIPNGGLPKGTYLEYEVLDETCGNVLISRTSISDSLDISSIASSNKKLCLNVYFTASEDEKSSPILEDVIVSYQTANPPAVKFRAKVKSEASAGDILNQVNISTSDLDVNLANNSDSYLLSLDLDNPASDLSLYYDANGSYNGSGQTITDLSGNNHDGTLGDNDTVNTDDPIWIGEGEQYFTFDGSDDFLKTGLSSDFSSDISLETWFRRNSSNSTGGSQVEERLISVLDLDNNSPGLLGLGIQDKTIQVQSEGDNSIVVNSNFIPNTEWQHVILTYNNSTNEGHIYINGVLHPFDSAAFTNTLGTPSSDKITIGSHYLSKYFQGDIALVRIYNKALTQEEVSYNYNSEKDRFGFTNTNIRVEIPSDLNFADVDVQDTEQFRSTTLQNITFSDRRENFVPWTAVISVDQNLTNQSDNSETLEANKLFIAPNDQEVNTGSGRNNNPSLGTQFTQETVPVTLFENTQINGGGKFILNPDFTLTIPPYSAAGTYQGTIVVSVS